MVYQLENFVENYQNTYSDLADVTLHSEIKYRNKKYPLVSIRYGSPDLPALILAGGVHGLERIGAQLVLSFLNSFHQRLQWDEVFKELLKRVQVVFMPLVNPVGYFEITRANPNGVDIARNAPLFAEEKIPFLLGGQNYSNKLPWYRGSEVQQETQFVIDTVKKVLSTSPHVISIDVHSGFGFKDQIWFPFSNSKKEFTQINQLYLFFELFTKTHPQHIYKIEPQSQVYLTDGDMWDYCFLNHKNPNQVYLPLTLEMGSWIWVKKNPLQVFSKTGLFNPIKEHRLNRTLRRHRPFLEFVLHSLASHQTWTHPELAQSGAVADMAKKKYYDSRKKS